MASLRSRVSGRVEASACFRSASALARSVADGGCLGGLPGLRLGIAPVAGLGGGNSASVRSCAGVEALLSSESESLDCSGVPYS